MKPMERVTGALESLGLKHRTEKAEDGIDIFDIIIDEGDDIAVTGLLYQNDDGDFFRLLAYIDELSTEKPMEQLSILMALNGEVPYGAYCMDPMEQVIYFTINIPVDEAMPKVLGYLVDFLMVAQDVYDQEFPDLGGEEELPQG